MDSEHEYKIYCTANVLGIKKIKAMSLEEAIEITKTDNLIKINEIDRQNGACKIDMDLSRKVNESIEEFHSDKSKDSKHIEYLDWGSE